MRYRVFVLWAALLALAVPGQLRGQSISLSPAVLTMPTAGVAQLNAEYVDHGGTTITVDPGSATSAWDLYLTAEQGSLRAGKPIADLQWRLEGSSSWTSASTSSQRLAGGIGAGTVKVYFRVRVRWTGDPPGDYGTGLTFSLSKLI